MPSFTSHVFRDKELSDISSKIDDLIGNIPLPDEDNPVEDVTGKFIDQVLLKDDNKKGNNAFGSIAEQEKLFDDVSVPAERLARYAVYREINRSVPIIKRIIKVYTSHLLQKNPVDGKCLIYRDASKVSQEDDDKVKNSRVFAEKIEKHFDIPGKLKTSICPKQLLYGNCFVEIVDVKSEAEKIDLSKIGLINEVENLENQVKSFNGQTSITQIELMISKISDVLHEVVDGAESTSVEKVDAPLGKVSEEKQNEEVAKKTEKDIMNPFLDIVIKIHEPHSIIILQSKYGTRLGYLEVYKDPSVESYTVAQSISNVIGKITSLNRSNIPEQTIIDKIIEKILKKTLLKSKDFSNDKIDSALKALGDDVYIFIKRLFIEQDIGNKYRFKRLKTRFIPINRMVDFSIPSNDYAPYGESVVDSLILPCKLYMLAQLSNVIIKLSRAAVVRKWVNNIAPYWSNPIKKIALIQGNS